MLSDSELESELIRLSDSYTDELYDCGQAAKVIFPVSRLVVDPEMIEINRALYMDEKSGKRTAKFEQTKNKLKAILLELINRVSRM